jgi:hypothetical protein
MNEVQWQRPQLAGDRRPNLGAQLVHTGPQMRSPGATWSDVSHSKQIKRGVYEQDRKN